MFTTPQQILATAFFAWALGLPIAGPERTSTRSAEALEFSDIAKEGELRYLASHPEPHTYRYESHVRISPDSLQTGLVQLSTCHYQLDPIRKVVIAFNKDRLRTLKVVKAEGIEKVEVDRHLVVLTQVARGASICIDLDSQALDPIDQNSWRLQAGPLMRRYLDGYLPMSADLHVYWTEGLLRVQETDPQPQPGVVIKESPSGAQMQLIFAGRFKGSIVLAKRP
ncbi:MAG: hypothetical protein RL397_570 [Pseudomonadota bacterium]|jgi:hypothetical protein